MNSSKRDDSTTKELKVEEKLKAVLKEFQAPKSVRDICIVYAKPSEGMTAQIRSIAEMVEVDL